jgi:hypothetical protein
VRGVGGVGDGGGGEEEGPLFTYFKVLLGCYVKEFQNCAFAPNSPRGPGPSSARARLHGCRQMTRCPSGCWAACALITSTCGWVPI